MDTVTLLEVLFATCYVTAVKLFARLTTQSKKYVIVTPEGVGVE
jgi:hypothetical protein